MMSQPPPQPYHFATDGVNPDSVPYKTTSTGARMPVVGLGTFGSDHYSIESIAEVVKGAIEVGYRHIDCAAVYGNEHLVGQSLRDAVHDHTQSLFSKPVCRRYRAAHGRRDGVDCSG